MPYCKSCGAYIPDGLSACLACGFDESAESTAAAAVKDRPVEKSANNEDMREILERHRKLQQEKNRQWAESERERRDKQAENARWAQEEYARRQAEREVEAERRQQEERARREEEQKQAASQTANRSETVRFSSSAGNRTLAALSYLSFLFIGPFLFAPEDEYAKFHAKQGLRLFIFGAITDLIASIVPFGFILTLFRIYCIYKGMTNALNGKKEPLPYIGTIGGN